MSGCAAFFCSLLPRPTLNRCPATLAFFLRPQGSSLTPQAFYVLMFQMSVPLLPKVPTLVYSVSVVVVAAIVTPFDEAFVAATLFAGENVGIGAVVNALANVTVNWCVGRPAA